MPRSTVGGALRTRTVFCILLLLFLNDGGGGGELWRTADNGRLFCHRSNEAWTGAQLVFIADEVEG